MVTESPTRLASSLINETFTPLVLTEVGAYLLDQRQLPSEEVWLTLSTAEAMADAIETMVVRGAPAIGIAAAYGMVLSCRAGIQQSLTEQALLAHLSADAERLRQTRPTAVNLGWALDEMLAKAQQCLTESSNSDDILAELTTKAIEIHDDDIRACHAIGELGAQIIHDALAKKRPAGLKNATIMTHCNAGALATGGYGTALGVIRSLVALEPSIRVIASETRPRLQGAKLTAWELARDGIDVTVITDNMAASLMRASNIDAVVTGADRITANGDAANKIGTYSHALAAKAHNIPFVIAAPMSTVDKTLASGNDIPIEERDYGELFGIYGDNYPNSVQFLNPGFDVTPVELITAIVTEDGVFPTP